MVRNGKKNCPAGLGPARLGHPISSGLGSRLDQKCEKLSHRVINVKKLPRRVRNVKTLPRRVRPRRVRPCR